MRPLVTPKNPKALLVNYLHLFSQAGKFAHDGRQKTYRVSTLFHPHLI